MKPERAQKADENGGLSGLGCQVWGTLEMENRSGSNGVLKERTISI